MADDLSTPPDVSQPDAPLGNGLNVNALLGNVMSGKTPYDAQVSSSIAASQEKAAEAADAQREKLAAESAKAKEISDYRAQNQLQQYHAQQIPDPPKFGMSTYDLKGTLSTIVALSALGGMLTRAPLTAMLNNFSAGVQGYMQGNMAAYKNNMEQWKANFEKAKNENDNLWKEVQSANEKNKGDLEGLRQDYTMIAAEHQDNVALKMLEQGNALQVAKLWETQANNFRSLQGKALTVAASSRAHADAMMNQEEARKDRMAIAELAHQDRQAALSAREANGGKITASEEKASGNWNMMSFSNNELKKLEAKGTMSVPLSQAMWGKLIDPETGNLIPSAVKQIRDSLQTPEQQTYFTASLEFALAQAHALGGARPTPFQMQNIWNAQISLEGDSPQTLAYKRSSRENSLESVKVMGGKGITALEKARAAERAPAALETPPPLKDRVVGKTKWRGHTWTEKDGQYGWSAD